MTRSALATLGALLLLAGCAPATSTRRPPNPRTGRSARSTRAPFEHSGRMKDACLISRGYTVSYSTNGGGVDVTARNPASARR